MELVRDPALQARVREEVQSALIPGSDPKDLQFNITELCNGPLLQSIYAETLRLRVAIVITRNPEWSEYQLGEWVFPKDELIAISSRTAAMDKEIWNTGTVEDPHPLTEFWSDRFLVYPNDPISGPLKKRNLAEDEKPSSGSASLANQSRLEEPRFAMEGLSGAWVPYGGGQRMCPGRHFAKQEMIASFAILCTAYDIEIVTGEGSAPEPDMRYFPYGALPPKGDTPFRIRRRQLQSAHGPAHQG